MKNCHSIHRSPKAPGVILVNFIHCGRKKILGPFQKVTSTTTTLTCEATLRDSLKKSDNKDAHSSLDDGQIGDKRTALHGVLRGLESLLVQCFRYDGFLQLPQPKLEQRSEDVWARYTLLAIAHRYE